MTNIYASFDVFPSSKGSATHIKEMVSELSTHGEQLKLLCLRGNNKLPAVQQHKNITIKRYYSEERLNYLDKAALFSEEIFLEAEKFKGQEGIAHFRDIWSGMGILAHKQFKSVFEVNALTSIELPYRYPHLTEGFLLKLKALEQKCLTNTDVIITPSQTTKEFLIANYTINPNKIEVIQNGAHIPDHFKKPEDAPENYIIYFGALQAWQGIDILIKAMTFLIDFTDLKLLICSSVKDKATKPIRKLVEKLELNDRVIFKSKLKREELYNYIHYAKLSIAPLKACDRNIIQGASPLKILEAMACQTTVVASDLPIVREIVSSEEALLFEPNRELDLARCIRYLLDSPEERKLIASRAFEKLKNNFTWTLQLKKLRKVYQSLKVNHE